MNMYTRIKPILGAFINIFSQSFAIYERRCGRGHFSKNVISDNSKYVTKWDFTLSRKRNFTSFASLLNYFLIHYLKKTLILQRNVPTTGLPIFKFEKQATIFLH